MSKLINKLTRTTQAGPQIGFRATQAAPVKQRMLLVAALANENSDATAEQLAGADAGLLRISRLDPGTRALEKRARETPDVLWGAWLEGKAADKLKQLSALGGDFLVLGASGAAVPVSPDDDTGIILQVEASISENLLRTVDDLPVDALLLIPENGEGQPITWYQLMRLQRVANLVGKPLLLSIPVGTPDRELQLFREAGIDGVVVEVSADEAAAEISRLRQVIDSLEPPSPRKRPKMDVLLPRAPTEPEAAIETEEEEDEED